MSEAKKKIFVLPDIPITELVLMYLRSHESELKSPNDYVSKFVEIRFKMWDAFNLEKKRFHDKQLHEADHPEPSLK